MGSGNRLKFHRNDGFGIGFGVSRFPFAITISVWLLFWVASVGLGKAYDESQSVV